MAKLSDDLLDEINRPPLHELRVGNGIVTVDIAPDETGVMLEIYSDDMALTLHRVHVNSLVELAGKIMDWHFRRLETNWHAN